MEKGYKVDESTVYNYLVGGKLAVGSYLQITEYRVEEINGTDFVVLLEGYLVSDSEINGNNVYPIATDSRRVVVHTNMFAGLSLPASINVMPRPVEAARRKQVLELS